jgi:phage/plasmid-like protein (TIGR03299 family)
LSGDNLYLAGDTTSRRRAKLLAGGNPHTGGTPLAHAVETMFWVNQPPWHGLGVRLEGNPTVEQAVEASGLGWEVELVPLVTADAGEAAPARAVRRAADRRVLGVVGPAYHSLQNRAAFAWFEPFLDAGLARMHTGGSLHGGKKVWLLAQVNRDPIEVGPDDAVGKFMLLSNSHDGTTSVRVGFTPVRIVCANTLALAHSGRAGGRLIRVRHTRRLADNLDALQEVLNAADREFAATAEQYRRLRNRGVNQNDLARYIRQTFGMEGGGLGGQRRSILESCFRLFEEGPGAREAGANLWGAYNAVTAYLSYERGNGRDGRLNSLWFGESARTNCRALEVGLAMAG